MLSVLWTKMAASTRKDLKEDDLIGYVDISMDLLNMIPTRELELAFDTHLKTTASDRFPTDRAILAAWHTFKGVQETKSSSAVQSTMAKEMPYEALAMQMRTIPGCRELYNSEEWINTPANQILPDEVRECFMAVLGNHMGYKLIKRKETINRKHLEERRK